MIFQQLNSSEWRPNTSGAKVIESGALSWSQTGIWHEQEIVSDFHLILGGKQWNLFNINFVKLQKEWFLNMNINLEVGSWTAVKIGLFWGLSLQ